MKAAVMFQNRELPEYIDFPEPIPLNEDEILVTVKAVALKHFDKHRATGKHYSAEAPAGEGRVAGGDAACVLEDGLRVYGMGVSGTLAEKATIRKDWIVKIPDGLDDASAAALPNAVIGSAMGLKFKAQMQPGDVVLINGATGFTGRVAVQVAKHWGAGRIIATGRNPQALEVLLDLGADEVINIQDDDFNARIKQIHAVTPIDIVLDYLWGTTAEMILDSLKGSGSFTHPVKFVSVGSMGGEVIQLSSSILRGTDIQLTGSGLGSWPKQMVGELFSNILPEMFSLAAQGKLTVDTVTVGIGEIASVWDLEVNSGQRVVIAV